MKNIEKILAVAPMMDWTDRHCRYFHRLLSRKALLFTEMVTTGALIHGDVVRHLEYSAEEHPLALQLGGAEPDDLRRAVEKAGPFLYDEINLNVGCPSDRVQNGCFGAALMKEPERVARCLAAMVEASEARVSVKCRIGVDDQVPEEVLPDFIRRAAEAGVTRVYIHARKAWLQGLSPKENREIPPLDHSLVLGMKAAFPNLEIILNGGITSLEEAAPWLEKLDGVMIGRAAYQRPGLLLEVDREIYRAEESPSLDDALARYQDYAARMMEAGVPLARLVQPLLGLFPGQRGAKAFRRSLAEGAREPGASPALIETSRALVA